MFECVTHIHRCTALLLSPVMNMYLIFIAYREPVRCKGKMEGVIRKKIMIWWWWMGMKWMNRSLRKIVWLCHCWLVMWVSTMLNNQKGVVHCVSVCGAVVSEGSNMQASHQKLIQHDLPCRKDEKNIRAQLD